MEQTSDKKENWLSRLSLKHILFVTLLNLCILIAILTLTILLVNNGVGYVHGHEERIANDQSVDSSIKLTLSDKLRILSRKDWLARTPVEPPNRLKTPISLVVITHSATENCTQISDCKDMMRDIQNFHMDTNGWWDIGSNFLIGGDGYVYEGRGWTSEAAHTYGYNSKSIGIGFIGTFDDIQPPDWQVKAALDLMEEGVKLNYLTKDFKVIGQRQVRRTLSPGDELYKIVTTWTHWSENP